MQITAVRTDRNADVERHISRRALALSSGTAETFVGKYLYAALSSVITLAAKTTYQIMGYGHSKDAASQWESGSNLVNSSLGLSHFRAEPHQGKLGFENLNGVDGSRMESIWMLFLY